MLYEKQGHFDKAEPLYQRALVIFEKALGEDHPQVAATLNNLAYLYQAQGHYDKAKPLYQRALANLREDTWRGPSPCRRHANNLAYLYQAQGHYDKAEPLHQRALKISEKALGTDHPSVAATLKWPRRALPEAGPL